MDILNIKERLNKLETGKLIDIVKNYRQYGYTDEIRTYAITLLENQGISIEDLRLTGNLENATYNHAKSIFLSFTKNSIVAFIAYCLLVLLKGLSIYHFIEQNTLISAILIILTIVFIIFLARSFLNQNDFYKLTGDSYGSEGALIYFLLGMPLYIFMYFFFRKQMSERMNLIE